MREVTMYMCEICNEIHNSPLEAVECEKRGKETPLKKIHETVEYEMKVGGGFDSFYIPLRIGSIDDAEHYIIYKLEECDEVNEDWYEFTSIYGNENLLSRIK
jgi:hypothetical protein